MVRYIPLELVHLIASAALALGVHPTGEERRARFALAKSLSLVCREWRPVGQGALFRKVFIYAGQPNHEFLRSRHHLLSHVYELEVDAQVGSAMLDNKLARCRRDCDKLRSVRLANPGAWSAWFSPTRKVSPAESVLQVTLRTISGDPQWARVLSDALSGSRHFPNASEVSLKLSSKSTHAVFPDFKGTPTWTAVRNLLVVLDLHIVAQKSLLSALQHVFPLVNLTTLTLSSEREPVALIPILRETTALHVLFLAIPSFELSSFAGQLAPTLAAMTSLEALTIQQNEGQTRRGGHQILPLPLLDSLPGSLFLVDLDLAVANTSRAAVEGFLTQRLGGPLGAWLTTTIGAHGAHERERWNKVVRDGALAWARE